MRSDDLTMVAPACAIATAQKTRDASITRIDGSTVCNTDEPKFFTRSDVDCCGVDHV